MQYMFSKIYIILFIFCIYSKGFVNEEGRRDIENAAAGTQAIVDAGRWVQATNSWSYTEFVVLQATDGVDFYNILAKEPLSLKMKPHSMDLSFMSPNISKTLRI